MLHAEQVLEMLGALSAEVNRLGALQAEIVSGLADLRETIAGEPEARPDRTVFQAAIAVIGRLRRQCDQAAGSSLPPGYAEAVQNARHISGLDDTSTPSRQAP